MFWFVNTMRQLLHLSGFVNNHPVLLILLWLLFFMPCLIQTLVIKQKKKNAVIRLKKGIRKILFSNGWSAGCVTLKLYRFNKPAAFFSTF